MLVCIMALSTMAILSFPGLHHRREHSRALGENYRNPSRQNQMNLEIASNRKRAIEISFQSFFLSVFSACGAVLLKLNRPSN